MSLHNLLVINPSSVSGTNQHKHTHKLCYPFVPVKLLTNVCDVFFNTKPAFCQKLAVKYKCKFTALAKRISSV